ncbi:hypothetical protein ADUPG1_009366 [Aduncisulcus paluster]|uniref:Uncharacterized protein n=1 Tax=Aduncisulcus paluster TaxID=2918883 RepID=A0ABQ5KVB0_9EUKA|nr:hypothetical protein ADUPG1_009366 [Aduncisulcus paluster]
MSSSTDAVIQTVKPEFVHEGEWDCCPIPRDAPNIKSAEFSTMKGIDETKVIDETKKKRAKRYYQSSNAQKMMKGGGNDGHFTHISIPFSSPSSPMKGAYICLHGLGNSWIPPPSHLIFTLTSSKGEKTAKKYEFPEFKGYRWYFLPVDLPDVVLCEITGKGREEDYFCIESLVFISREETPEEITSREAREKLWSEAQLVEPEFVQGEGEISTLIPHDDPKLVDPSFSIVKCKNDAYGKESVDYDDSSRAQRMLKGECGDVSLSHISIPFPSLPSPMKGAYICLSLYGTSPSLLFTFTDCDGKKTGKKYEFTEPEEYDYEWHFLPIDLDNVVLCEIEGKGRWDKKNSRDFYIESLVFIREETPEEIKSREAREKLWSKAPVVKPEFVSIGYYSCGILHRERNRDSIPIPRHDTKLVDPSFPMVKCKNAAYRNGSEGYDESSNAQKMLKGECGVDFSHLSIPFPSPSPMKGAYICVNKDDSSPSLLFTFTDCDGKKTFKKYEFTESEYEFEWYFLPIDLMNVVLCEIEGKGQWCDRDAIYFTIESLIFTTFPEEITVERLSLLPWKLGSSNLVFGKQSKIGKRRILSKRK